MNTYPLVTASKGVVTKRGNYTAPLDVTMDIVTVSSAISTAQLTFRQLVTTQLYLPVQLLPDKRYPRYLSEGVVEQGQ